MLGAMQTALKELLTGGPAGFVRLKAGQSVDIKADIQEVSVPKL
jgi:hypothetical protein